MSARKIMKRFKFVYVGIIIFVLLLTISLFVIKIDAASDRDATTPPGGVHTDSCQASTPTCLYGYKGLRIKVVNQNGELYAGTTVLNLQFGSGLVNYIQNYRTWGDGKCSKLDYMNPYSGCNIKFDTDKTAGEITELKKTFINLDQFLTNTSVWSLDKTKRYSLNKDTGQINHSDIAWNMDKVLYYFSPTNWKKKYCPNVAVGSKDEEDCEEENKAAVFSFLEFMGINIDEWKKDRANQNGTFIVIEPTALIKYNNYFYWGTLHELAQAAYNDHNWYDANGNRLDSRRMINVLGKDMPCSSLLTGITNSNALGINWKNRTYFNEKIKWFTPEELRTNQFSINNAFPIKTPSSGNKTDTVCDSSGNYYPNKGFTKEIVRNSSSGAWGVGMAILWAGEIVPDELSCSEVDTYNPNLKSTIKREYERGNLKFYVVTQPPIKYKTKDNVEKKVDPYWYVSECSCYGIITDYKDKTNVDLSTKTKNELQSIFSSSTVFDALYNQLDKDSKNSDMYGAVTKWTYDKYDSLSCPYKNDPSIPPEPKYNCTPQFNVGDCSNGESITYIDQGSNLSEDEYWNNCVYADKGSYKINTHKQSKPNYKGSLSYYDNTLGGRYCEVYCTESLVTNFNANEIYVLAGQNFTWVDHSVNGSRTCKTKSIDWDIFKRELEKDNIDIERAYNKYIAKKLQVESVNVKTIDRMCPSICLAPPCAPPFPYTIVTINWKGYTVGSGAAMAQTSSGSAYYGCPSLFPPSNPPTPSSSEITSLKNAYERIKNNAINDYNNMVNCYTWNNNNVYNLNPNVTVSYYDNTYSYSDNLLTSTKYDIDINKKCEKTTVKVITGSSCSEAACTVKDGCSEKPCTIEEKEIENCEFYNATRSGTASFDYAPSGVFQYVLKEDNKSIHAWELNKYKTGATTPNYINIGYSNFPVAYKTPNGTYGVGKPNGGELSLSYYRLGHIKNGSTDLDSILSSYDVDPNRDYSNWQCEFTVASKLIPENNTNQGGINLIYRTIDLNNPFPGSKGEGRSTGSNWCYYNDCGNTNKTVKEVITNNRKVTTDEVYNKDPMYSFELTPAMIKAIREYNKENSYASYAGSLNGESYDFVCKEGTGKNCISEYVSYLIEQSEATGTCVSNTTRNSSDVTSFEKCRY